MRYFAFAFSLLIIWNLVCNLHLKFICTSHISNSKSHIVSGHCKKDTVLKPSSIAMKNWLPKNWCFWTVVLEKTLGSPLDCKEIKPVPPEGNTSWIFTGRTDAEAETPILWPPDAKSWLTGKQPDAGKDWRQEERGWQDELVGWHHQLDGHAFKHAPEVGDGQGSLAYCSPWGRRVRHNRVTELTDCNEARMSTLKFCQQKTYSDSPYHFPA